MIDLDQLRRYHAAVRELRLLERRLACRERIADGPDCPTVEMLREHIRRQRELVASLDPDRRVP